MGGGPRMRARAPAAAGVREGDGRLVARSDHGFALGTRRHSPPARDATAPFAPAPPPRCRSACSESDWSGRSPRPSPRRAPRSWPQAFCVARRAAALAVSRDALGAAAAAAAAAPAAPPSCTRARPPASNRRAAREGVECEELRLGRSAGAPEAVARVAVSATVDAMLAGPTVRPSGTGGPAGVVLRYSRDLRNSFSGFAASPASPAIPCSRSRAAESGSWARPGTLGVRDMGFKILPERKR